MSCRAKLELLSLLSRWKSQLGCKLSVTEVTVKLLKEIASLAVIATILWLRFTILKRKEEKYRAEELVQVVLKRLQDQVSILLPLSSIWYGPSLTIEGNPTLRRSSDYRQPIHPASSTSGSCPPTYRIQDLAQQAMAICYGPY